MLGIVRKGFNLQQLNSSKNQGIRSTIGVFVPAVGCTNFHTWKLGFDTVHNVEQFSSCKVASI